jgi:hypothetical protein
VNPIARFESACARVVEDLFARIFPSDLEPAQVGRKLVAARQAAPADIYLVRVHPGDYARLDRDRDFLEARWSALLRDAAPGEAGHPPRAVLHEDAGVVAGSVAIEAIVDDRPPALVLIAANGTRYPVVDGLTLGRSSENALTFADARMSRVHARIVADGGGFAIEDLGSSNGTYVDGRAVAREMLVPGSVVTLGDTNLRVAADG